MKKAQRSLSHLEETDLDDLKIIQLESFRNLSTYTT